MRLKPVGGSIRGKTSDGNTATASNNEISPEVEQRAGEHICVYVCMFVCDCMCGERRGQREEMEGVGERYCTHTVPPGTQRERIIKDSRIFVFLVNVILLSLSESFLLHSRFLQKHMFFDVLVLSINVLQLKS